MHNQIQELRGNVRVYVRTRPFLPTDSEEQPPAGTHYAIYYYAMYYYVDVLLHHCTLALKSSLQ
jgi:Microtubule binding